MYPHVRPGPHRHADCYAQASSASARPGLQLRPVDVHVGVSRPDGDADPHGASHGDTHADAQTHSHEHAQAGHRHAYGHAQAHGHRHTPAYGHAEAYGNEDTEAHGHAGHPGHRRGADLTASKTSIDVGGSTTVTVNAVGRLARAVRACTWRHQRTQTAILGRSSHVLMHTFRESRPSKLNKIGEVLGR